MKRVILVALTAFLFIIFLPGCAGDKAHELYETAKFEELQNNKLHARELYEEILKKYPKSDYAKKAMERLMTLNEGK
jgi:outer membrane protein assembly factor BamD (BamD/ComL family)